MQHNIWPENGTDPIIQIDGTTWELLRALAREKDRPDNIWEFARKIVESEQKAAAERERRANRDFTKELREIEALAVDVANRVDSTPYANARAISDLAEEYADSKRKLTPQDVAEFQKRWEDLVIEMAKTTEMASNLKRVINSMEEA